MHFALGDLAYNWPALIDGTSLVPTRREIAHDLTAATQLNYGSVDEDARATFKHYAAASPHTLTTQGGLRRS